MEMRADTICGVEMRLGLERGLSLSLNGGRAPAARAALPSLMTTWPLQRAKGTRLGSHLMRGGEEMDRMGVTSLCSKLEKFIIYHYSQPKCHPTEPHPVKNITRKKGGGGGGGNKKQGSTVRGLQQPTGKINMQMYARN